MSNLCFTLLGPPHVRHGDQMLLFSTRKEQALLLYLVVEGRLHLRKHLSELFWPEGDVLHGRAALRISLLHLRHLLGEDAGADTGPHLLITRDTLGLDLTSAIDLDLQTLHAAWTVARASTRTTRPMPADAHRSLLAQLQHAASLARGEFLEGFSLRDARPSTTGHDSNANTGTCISLRSSTSSPTCNSKQESLPLPLKTKLLCGYGCNIPSLLLPASVNQTACCASTTRPSGRLPWVGMG